MKRSIEVLVSVVAVLLLVSSTQAHAAAPVAKLEGDASLTQLGGGDASAAFHVDVAFSTDPPEAEPFTLQKAVLLFADRAGTNGRLFPSCSARQIERFGGAISRCPEGSKIGSGTVTATAIQLGIAVKGRVTMFNSRRGKSITFNVQADQPAYVNESFDAQLTRVREGRYGQQLTIVVPHSLQEVIPGVFVAVRELHVTLDGAIRKDGVRRTYIKARTCPKWAMRGIFSFKGWTTGQSATTTASAKVRCTDR